MEAADMDMTPAPQDMSSPIRYVAPGDVPYDSGAIGFCRLLDQGLREHHKILDFGAGSLRVGRFLITMALPGNYYAIEPQDWLLNAGLELMGKDIANVKVITLDLNSDFNLDVFAPTKFDFILISSIFTHTSHAHIETIMRTAAKALAPGGLIVGDYRDCAKSGKDYVGTEWVYPQVTPHEQGCIEGAAAGNGWEFTELDRDPYGALWFTIGGKE